MAQTMETTPAGCKILQDDRFFKMGQDSILLSEFVRPPKRSKICDLGCGTGVIALMLLQKDPVCEVTGLEIQQEVCALAEENRNLNGFQDRFQIQQGDICGVRELLPANSFDYVVSNPPYFSPGSGRAAAEAHKKIARQEENGSLGEWIRAAAFLLRYGGKFGLVHRPERICEVISEMRSYRIEPKRLAFAYHRMDSQPSVLLIEGQMGAKTGCQVLPPVMIEKKG